MPRAFVAVGSGADLVRLGGTPLTVFPEHDIVAPDLISRHRVVGAVDPPAGPGTVEGAGCDDAQVDAVVVRAGVDEDVPALRDVFRRASWSNEQDRPVLTEHPELLDWSPAAIPEGRVRVACVAGRMVGFASTASHGDTMEIEDLFVDPDWSRQGIGRRLVEDVVARSTVSGARRIEVDAGEDAVAFYQRVGFGRVSTVPVEYGVAVRLVREIPGLADPGSQAT